jgi:hypothetical protein
MRYKGALIVAKGIEKAGKHHHGLLRPEALQDSNGNMVQIGGLFLKAERHWKIFLGKEVIYKSNSPELYSGDPGIEKPGVKMKTLCHDAQLVNSLAAQKTTEPYDLDGSLIEIGALV